MKPLLLQTSLKIFGADGRDRCVRGSASARGVRLDDKGAKAAETRVPIARRCPWPTRAPDVRRRRPTSNARRNYAMLEPLRCGAASMGRRRRIRARLSRPRRRMAKTLGGGGGTCKADGLRWKVPGAVRRSCQPPVGSEEPRAESVDCRPGPNLCRNHNGWMLGLSKQC